MYAQVCAAHWHMFAVRSALATKVLQVQEGTGVLQVLYLMIGFEPSQLQGKFLFIPVSFIAMGVSFYRIFPFNQMKLKLPEYSSFAFLTNMN